MRKTPNNRFPKHFRDFIEELNRYQVEYVLIGGYAMGAYGHHRGTGDLDIFINASESNANKMVQACHAYGIPEEQIQTEMFLVPRMIGIGKPPLRIEIIKHLDKVDFEYAFQRSELKKVDELQIRVVGLDDLIILKKAAAKSRSKARDAEDLTFLQALKSRLNRGK